MAGEIDKKRPTHGKPAHVAPARPKKCRKLLCNSLLHSLTTSLASQITRLAHCQSNGVGFMLSEGGSGPEKREKAGEFEQNAAQEIESAERIAVPVLSIRGEERLAPGTVMLTTKWIAQRTLFFT